MTLGNSRADRPNEESLAFYRTVVEELIAIGVPFLVGGAFAFRHHTGIDRCTRDFDVFMLPEDVPRTLELLNQRGHDSAVVFPHWLAKVKWGSDYVDLIYSAGNGIAKVDAGWFEHAIDGEILGLPVRFCPIEETIWSKAFIMERERFDGADVLHLILAKGAALDWRRLRERFGPNGRVLLSHLVLFGFVYPQEKHLVPEWLLRELIDDLARPSENHGAHVCLGTLLSRSQYLPDLDRGLRDGRLPPSGTMSTREITIWTDAAEVPEPHAE